MPAKRKNKSPQSSPQKKPTQNKDSSLTCYEPWQDLIHHSCELLREAFTTPKEIMSSEILEYWNRENGWFGLELRAKKAKRDAPTQTEPPTIPQEPEPAAPELAAPEPTPKPAPDKVPKAATRTYPGPTALEPKPKTYARAAANPGQARPKPIPTVHRQNHTTLRTAPTTPAKRFTLIMEELMGEDFNPAFLRDRMNRHLP